MAKNVQITAELWNLLIEYFFTEEDEDQLILIEREICHELNSKIDKLIAREYYTRYKSDPSPDVREHARQKYLDHKGIPEDFRW